MTELLERHFFQLLYPFCGSSPDLSCSPRCETKSSCFLSVSAAKTPPGRHSSSYHSTLKSPGRSSEAPSQIESTAFQIMSTLLYNLDQMLWITHGVVCAGDRWVPRNAEVEEEKWPGGRKTVSTGYGGPPFFMQSHSVDSAPLPWSLCNVPRGVLTLLFFSAFSQQSTLMKNPMAMNGLIALPFYLMNHNGYRNPENASPCP